MAIPHAFPEALQQDAEPWNDACYQDRHKVIPSAGAMMDFGQETLKMLMDEKEMGKFGVAHRDHDKPRRRDGEKQDQALDQMQALPDAPIARDQRIEHQHGARQHDPD